MCLLCEALVNASMKTMAFNHCCSPDIKSYARTPLTTRLLCCLSSLASMFMTKESFWTHHGMARLIDSCCVISVFAGRELAKSNLSQLSQIHQSQTSQDVLEGALALQALQDSQPLQSARESEQSRHLERQQHIQRQHLQRQHADYQPTDQT